MLIRELRYPVPIHRRVARRARTTVENSRQSWEMFATVPLGHLLRGGEAGLGARQFAAVAEDPCLPSTPIDAWPHTLLLQEYARDGEAVFDPDRITQTAYYRNAFKVVDAVGYYFDVQNP